MVENAFGILAAWWRVLGKAMACSVKTAEDITKACVAVHNYLCGLDQAEQASYIHSTFVDSVNAVGGGSWWQETPTSFLQDVSLLSGLHNLVVRCGADS